MKLLQMCIVINSFTVIIASINIKGLNIRYRKAPSQLAQRRYDNVVTTSLLTLSQSCGTVENESYTDVGFRRCDKVALRHYEDVATTLLQRRHNIKHWISRPFYYRLF